MKILIGTLFCGENEFEECKKSIHRQTHKEYEHFVLSNLPNKEAHYKLYHTFMERSSEFALFLKVDADMVLARDDVLALIVAWFKNRPNLLKLTMPLHDFFTDRRISGMHAFRSCVTWQQSGERLFVDQDNIPRDRREKARGDLSPAGLHSPNPSAFQAFHFGIHKALKARQASEKNMPIQRLSHWMNIEFTYRNFQKRRDPRLLWASLGCETGLLKEISPDALDYDSPKFRALFDNFSDADLHRLERKVRWLRLWNRRLIPGRLHLRMVREGSIRAVRRSIWEVISGQRSIIRSADAEPSYEERKKDPGN